MSTTVVVTEENIALTYSEAQGLPGPQGEQGPQGYPGDITVPVPYLKYDPLGPVPVDHLEGRTYWNPDCHCLTTQTEVPGVEINVGEESQVPVRNNSGETILNGQVVYITGALGQRSTVALARADSILTSESVLGLATADIPNNTVGRITTSGIVRDLDTSAFDEGDWLYLSTTVYGGLTATPPTSPDRAIRVGQVTYSNVANGTISVAIDLGNRLEGLHDVLVTSPLEENVIAYDGVKWVNRQGFTGWDDLRFPAQGINPIGAVSDPTVDTSETGFFGTLIFSGTADNVVSISAQMSHTWAAGTAIYPHIHWANPVGTASEVTWQLYYRKIGSPGDNPEAWVGPLAGTTNGGDPTVSDQTLRTVFPAVAMTGLNESAMILFRLYRRGSTDASISTARLYEFDIHYFKNKFGTTETYPI